MAMFETDDFMGMQVDGELSTDYVKVPPNEYTAVIKEIKTKSGTSNKDPSNPRPWVIAEIYWSIDDPAVKEATGRDENTVRQSIFLDMENGRLDMGKGKNVQLGRLREAVGQNRPGPWAPSMLLGQVAVVRVEHDAEGYANVTAVAKLG